MQPTMSKGDFARHINVTPGRVSQYIAAGMIGRDALEGEGRSAKVIVARAMEQIRQRRDIGQALGNGLSTRLDLDEPDGASDVGDPRAGIARPLDDGAPLKPQNVDDQIKLERLESERRRNRVAAQEEAQQLGRLVDAATVRTEVARAVQMVEDFYTGMLADLATAAAAKPNLPQRDYLHMFRQIRNEKKAALAAREQRRAAALPERVDVIIEGNAA